MERAGIEPATSGLQTRGNRAILVNHALSEARISLL
jgi:hypothetical protein